MKRTTQFKKKFLTVLAAGAALAGCNQSSGHGGVETKIDIFPVTFRVEAQTDKPFYLPGELIQLQLTMSNYSTATVFSSGALGCGEVPVSVEILDESGASVFSHQDDCIDPLMTFSIKPGESISRSLTIDVAAQSGQPLLDGSYLIEAGVHFTGPLPSAGACYQEGSLTVCATGGESTSRIPIRVLGGIAPNPLLISPLTYAPRFRIFGQADQPFYSSGGTARVQTLVENMSGQDVYGLVFGCLTSAEIFEVQGMNLNLVRSEGICPAVIYELSVPSGSDIKSDIAVSLVDDNDQILPTGFYVIRLRANLGQISPVSFGSVYQGPSVAGAFPAVDIPIRIF